MKKQFKLLFLTILWLFYKIIPQSYKENEMAVLMYHSISENSWEFSITREFFERQIKYLKRNGYKFLAINEFYESLTGKRPMPDKSVLLTFDDGYKDFMINALPIIEKYNLPAVVFVHTNRSSEHLGNSFPLIDWNDLRKLKELGITIGNHSHNHHNLKTLTQNELEEEIRESGNIFQKEIREMPRIISYPGGRYNQSVIEFLLKNGFTLGFTINEGLVMQNDDLMEIKRVSVEKKISMLEFKIKLTKVVDWYQYLRKLINSKK